MVNPKTEGDADLRSVLAVTPELERMNKLLTVGDSDTICSVELPGDSTGWTTEAARDAARAIAGGAPFWHEQTRHDPDR